MQVSGVSYNANGQVLFSSVNRTIDSEGSIGIQGRPTYCSISVLAEWLVEAVGTIGNSTGGCNDITLTKTGAPAILYYYYNYNKPTFTNYLKLSVKNGATRKRHHLEHF